MSKVDDSDVTIKRGGRNVFADLGCSDPGTHLLKAQLVSRIEEVMTDKKK